MNQSGEPWRILVVCTANVCRSPVVQRLLQRRLDEAGLPAVVTSAGTRGGRLDPHHDTVRAAATRGVDLGGHLSRPLTGDIIRHDGADLVIAMTREHLRAVIGVESAAWPRTFTLKELARRGLSTPLGAVGLGEWLAAAGEGRRAAGLMGPSVDDDIGDPYGGPYGEHLAMVDEVDDLVTRLVRLLPVRD